MRIAFFFVHEYKLSNRINLVCSDGASENDINSNSNSPSKEKMAQHLASHLSDSMASFITHGNNRLIDDSKMASCGGQQMKKEQDSNVRVTLHNKDMWDKFHAVGTEMIITKAGRYVLFQNLIIFNRLFHVSLKCCVYDDSICKW